MPASAPPSLRSRRTQPLRPAMAAADRPPPPARTPAGARAWPRAARPVASARRSCPTASSRARAGPPGRCGRRACLLELRRRGRRKWRGEHQTGRGGGGEGRARGRRREGKIEAAVDPPPTLLENRDLAGEQSSRRGDAAPWPRPRAAVAGRESKTAVRARRRLATGRPLRAPTAGSPRAPSRRCGCARTAAATPAPATRGPGRRRQAPASPWPPPPHRGRCTRAGALARRGREGRRRALAAAAAGKSGGAGAGRHGPARRSTAAVLEGGPAACPPPSSCPPSRRRDAIRCVHRRPLRPRGSAPPRRLRALLLLLPSARVAAALPWTPPARAGG